ncbi:ABC-three component system protein [Streptomyces sp. NBC_01497]|uniref:ABC-three component system protein n=1 Tax=Streptomyces sp. NBC_01497 TaxID=2903885 RepID=UPI002E353B5F|nr:ABC-three component system protein [Streptomyces sp. NBC_01497]
MLRQLRADDERFKTVTFQSGLNLLVAETTDVSRSTDSRNGSGKSSMIELLHFLLGGRPDNKHLVAREELRRTTFTLSLDWPELRQELRVSRSGGDAKTVTLDPAVARRPGPTGLSRIAEPPSLWEVAEPETLPVTVAGPQKVHFTEWQALIEENLFGLTGDHPGVSGRALLSFLIRRVGDHGFNEAVRSFARQPEGQAAPNLAYLLGLDSSLAARYQAIAVKKNARDQLKKAVNDPVWGRVVGKAADLRGEIAVQSSKIEELRRQIAAFRVVPQYEALKEQADKLTRRIQDLSTQDIIDRRNLDHLERSVEEAVDPEVRYLEQVYDELGVTLPQQALRRFDDVRAFHAAVVRNRRIYLKEEIAETRQRLDARKAERARLDDEQSRILKDLNDGGALEALTTLQKVLAQEEATLGALQHRLEAAQAVEESSREIEASRLELTREVDTDLQERQEQITQATVLFNELAGRLYGSDRPAYLSVEAGRNTLKITPKISSDVSQGINKMSIFCFDLTMAVIAHREGRAPDFLVHDSHIFDGVDDRQLTRALEIAVDVTAAEGMQYVVTINEDDLGKARNLGFNPAPYLIEPLLTDSYEGGGLFGFRFER